MTVRVCATVGPGLGGCVHDASPVVRPPAAVSSINVNSLSGFESLDDNMIENLLIQMAKGFDKKADREEKAPKGAGSGVYDTDTGSSDEAAEDVAEVTDDSEL
jgi:hypothetical protein